jgi:hypothetical protein
MSSLAVVSSANAGDDSELDYRFTLVPKKKLPIRRVERPLILPLRHYELRTNAHITQLDPATPIVSLEIGASYGISSNWEVGILLLPLSFSASADSGVGTPEFIARYQLFRGVLEGAFEFSSILPLVGEVSPTLKFLTRTHLGAWASIDLGAFARYEFIDAMPNFQAGAPAEFKLQILDSLSLSISGEVALTDSARKWVSVWAQSALVYTFHDTNGPSADIGAGVRTANSVLQGGMPADPALGNYPAIYLFANFYYLEDPDYRAYDF